MTEPQDSWRALDWQHGPHRQRPVTNGYAIASLVLGIVWLWLLGSVLALVFVQIARYHIIASSGGHTSTRPPIGRHIVVWSRIATSGRLALTHVGPTDT